MSSRHLKMLGLSLLALVGVMSVGASGAQAKWLLLLDKVSVLKQTFNVTLNELELLVPKIGLKTFCTGGTSTSTSELNGTHTVRSGSTGIIKLTGCKDLSFKEVCQTMGAGDPDGTISFGGSGVSSMEGEKVLDNVESALLANVEYLGEECPFTEIDCKISGSVWFETLEPLKEAVLHQVHIVKQSLFCGKNSAELHAGHPGQGRVSGSFTTLKNETSAIHLVGL